MSTLGDIAQAVKDKKLFPWKHFTPDPTFKYRRQLFAMEEIAAKCGMEGFSDSAHRFKRGTLTDCRHLLDQFVGGEPMCPIYDLKHLELPIWEFKMHPENIKSKATRILGWFCDDNTFIATHAENREDLHNFNSPEWQKTMAKLHRKHQRICPNLVMLNRGNELSKYIV